MANYGYYNRLKPKRGKFKTDNGTITIKSDLRSKPFAYGHDVPKSVLENQFDYLDKDEMADGFLKYNGRWYHTEDFMLTDGLMRELGWLGVASDSYFSGVLIAMCDDGEEYIVGTYTS
jgi:hypothetical protein